jgi:molybdopterin/thiamine biosynthesis adenylyltransferase
MREGGDHAPYRDGRAAARPRILGPEGPLSPSAVEPSAPLGAGGARRLRLRPSVEPFVAADGHLYVLQGGSAATHVIRDVTSADRALVGALDGAPATVAELAHRLGTPVTSALEAALAQLVQLGLLSASDRRQRLSVGILARYDRQLAWLEDRFGDDRLVAAAQRRLAAARVCVLGCGGLGTWTAAALACVGIGTLVLADDDTVELSNLNRQILFGVDDLGRLKVSAAARALRRFDPDLAIVEHPTRLRSAGAVADVVAGSDFVVEAADWPMYEFPRWVDAACRRHCVPHLTAAQHPPTVRIGPLRVPGRSPCLACVEAAARERFPLMGDLETFRAARSRPAPTLGPACGLAGSLVATEILHALTGAHEPATLDRSLVFRLDTFESRLEPEPLVACTHRAPA